jgi:methylaspartate ammonia-lyase
MDVKDYCRSTEIELYGWKAKMYDMIRKVEQLRRADKEKIAEQVEQLHKHISEMERMIKDLQSECPVEFGDRKQKIDKNTTDMKKKYEDAMSAVLRF